MTAPAFPAQVSSHPVDVDVDVAVVEDWDVLLRAVTARLHLLVGDAPAADPLRAGVLECAAALGQVRLLIKAQMPMIAPRAFRRRRDEVPE